MKRRIDINKFEKLRKEVFYNILILNYKNKYLENRNRLIQEIEQEFDYWRTNKVVRIDDDSIIAELNDICNIKDYYSKDDFKILKDKNKDLKKSILGNSRDLILMVFTKFLKDCYRVLPAVFVVGGFIKAAIISNGLGIEMSTLFSIDDYWNFGVSDFFKILFFAFIAIYRPFLQQVEEVISIQHKYQSPERVKNYGNIKNSILLIGGIIISLSPIFLFFYFKEKYGVSLMLLFLLTTYIAAFVPMLFKNKHHITISLILLLFITINTRFEIDHILMNRPNNDAYEIIAVQPISNDSEYVLSTSKYHIFLNDETYSLLPSESVLSINIEKKDNNKKGGVIMF